MTTPHNQHATPEQPADSNKSSQNPTSLPSPLSPLPPLSPLSPLSPQPRRSRSGMPQRNSHQGRRQPRRHRRMDDDEFESTIIDLARVTRVMAGGKRMRFRACVIVGDRKGRVGMGLKKGADVQIAVAKATTAAKKKLLTVPMENGTIPHQCMTRFRGATVLLKPSRAGTGVIAGGVIRTVMEYAGVTNIVAKMMGSSNKINNVQAVLEGLRSLRSKETVEALRKPKEEAPMPMVDAAS